MIELSWLIDLFKKYEREDVEDLIAAYILSIGFDPKSTPPSILGVIDAVAARAGVERGEERKVSQAKIRRYFVEHPIDPELKVAFEQKLRASYAAIDSGALQNAFARFADEELPKKAPSKERPKGTRPGYLALLAHDDVEKPSR